MARPVSYNLKEKPLERDISIVDMPDGYQGEGFFASKLSDVVGLARRIHFGHCRLLPNAAALSLWQLWPRTTIWPVLAAKGWGFRHGSVTC
jgi:hypothetical protein